MFQLLKDTRVDFMSRGKLFLFASLAGVLISIGILAVKGVHKGIEFSGGTELQVKYKSAPDLSQIRDILSREGLGDSVVTTIGPAEDFEVYVRTSTDADPERDANMTSIVTRILRGDSVVEGKIDLNVADQGTIRKSLIEKVGLLPSEAEQVAETLTLARKDRAIFTSIDELATISGLPPDTVDRLKQHSYVGPLAVRSQSHIFPAVGQELLNKAMLAVLGSLIGMLIYIWFRFQLQWGMAAVLALAHDTVITLGLFSLFGMEMSLPVVAAFLTLIGYSVNDTVVIFDRIRENLKSGTGSGLIPTINLSINQTLSRTIITSGLTWIACFCLFVFGGSALRAFSFVMTVGVIVGTYSSIAIASPLLIVGQRFFGKQSLKPSPSQQTTGRARKVRAGGA